MQSIERNLKSLFKHFNFPLQSSGFQLPDFDKFSVTFYVDVMHRNTEP